MYSHIHVSTICLRPKHGRLKQWFPTGGPQAFSGGPRAVSFKVYREIKSTEDLFFRKQLHRYVSINVTCVSDTCVYLRLNVTKFLNNTS